jgi:hypothetical protein
MYTVNLGEFYDHHISPTSMLDTGVVQSTHVKHMPVNDVVASVRNQGKARATRDGSMGTTKPFRRASFAP